MTKKEVKEKYPEEYERGKQDAIQFAYIPEHYTKEQLYAWQEGYRSEKERQQ